MAQYQALGNTAWGEMGMAEDVENKDVSARDICQGLLRSSILWFQAYSFLLSQQAEAALHFSPSCGCKRVSEAWVALLWGRPAPGRCWPSLGVCWVFSTGLTVEIIPGRKF